MREAFEFHGTPAPDPAVVYARVRDLSRTYHRRRRAAQMAGTAVLSAGLVAGAIQVPSVLSGWSGSGGASVVAAQAGAAPSPSVAASYSQKDLDKDWAAYFAAGYGYDDAVHLGAVAHRPEHRAGQGRAGRRLLAGETLPVSPHPNPTTPVGPTAPDPVSAFFAAGYTMDDAITLAKLWKLKDPYAAKVLGGEKLLAGKKLPIQP